MGFRDEMRGTSQYEALARIATLTDAQEAALHHGDLFLATLLGEMVAAPAAQAAATSAPANAVWAAALCDHAGALQSRVSYAVALRQAEARRAVFSPGSACGSAFSRPSTGQGSGWYV